jgi:ABC-type dipeptide/oligopeptide/nickel transport system permease subunit
MSTIVAPMIAANEIRPEPPAGIWRQVLRSRRVTIGGGILVGMMFICVVTLFWTLKLYTVENDAMARVGPRIWPVSAWFGYDSLGRSILARSLFGGSISLAVGLAAATISVVLGVVVGLVAGYRGGWVDSALMRTVDILYGLPYVLLVILFKVAFERPLQDGISVRVCWAVVFLILAVIAWWCGAGREGNGKLIWRGAAGVMLLVMVVVYCLVPAPPMASAESPGDASAMATTEATTAPTTIPATGTPTTGIVSTTQAATMATTQGATTQASADAEPPSAVAKAKQPGIAFSLSAQAANLVVLFSAIGLVSWLTMARVVRGQVLSLRGQPFIEACRAMGVKEGRIFLRHILPNLIGPITVYATLTVPSAILQESFLSFLGVGVNPPLATWGSLASEGVEKLSPLKFYWWLLVFPCTLLAMTLLSLNFLGDGLRDVFDPKKEAAKI